MSTENSSPWKPVRRTLIVGLNWIGDTIMAMPAVEAWRRENPDAHLGILARRGLTPLWELHTAADKIIGYESTNSGTFAAARALREGRYDRACIFPNSFRTAIIPFIARTPERIGTAGQLRSLLLTRKVNIDPRGGHQAMEYFSLLGLAAPETVSPPRLNISEGARELAANRLEGMPQPVVGLIPGAARGPSKRWPAEHFAEVGKHFAREHGYGVALFGGPDDEELCESLRDQIGENTRSFAGKTSLKEWAALLASCRLVVCNDSGGMHLAAAVGTPLVAIYGLTDPRKTGPLGARCEIVRDENVTASRDIPRDSDAARKALAAITPAPVLEAAARLLAGCARPPVQRSPD